MKFLVDNQLPQLLSAYLQRRGHECAHVADLGLDEVDDAEVWARCLRDGSVLISKDEDFIFLAWRPRDTGRLLWVRLGNCRNAALIEAFDLEHDRLIAAFESGLRIVELR
jgi:predicted nuclease of predicted toxin-antitoxin system